MMRTTCSSIYASINPIFLSKEHVRPEEYGVIALTESSGTNGTFLSLIGKV